MATNTAYDPKNILDFEKSKLNKNAKGILAIAALNTTTNIDYMINDDLLLSGGSVVLVRNATWGDHVSFQILANGMVINQFITDWFLNPDKTEQAIPAANYPAKLSAGLVLRVAYTSVATELSPIPQIAINYNFEKVLE